MTFTEFTYSCADTMLSEHRYSTAHLYRNAHRAFSHYLGGCDVEFTDFTRPALRRFEMFLRSSGRSNNTISTYMRMLRSIYNKGVDRGYAAPCRRLFHDVYTGVEVSRRRSLTRKELHRLLYTPVSDARLYRVQQFLLLLYQLCGIPFVDLVHIRVGNIRDGYLVYNRHKTGTCVRVKLPEPVLRLFRSIIRGGSPSGNRYLFGIMGGSSINGSPDGYRKYQCKLRRFNILIQRLATTVGVRSRVSSYTIRHSWATAALNTGTPIEMISEMLGHRSIRTTQIYADGFDSGKMSAANARACRYAEKG